MFALVAAVVTMFTTPAVHRPAHREHKVHRVVISNFDLCVAGHEAGAGRVVTLANARAYAHDINWHIVDGEYEGGFQWLPSTWDHQRSRNDPVLARDATPWQQAAVFDAHENASEWPESVPACGG